MSYQTVVSNKPRTNWGQHQQSLRSTQHRSGVGSTDTLPISITKAASKQTYYTIRFLVDRDRIADAYRAYSYFRWVDDRLDEGTLQMADCIAFVELQQALIEGAYHGKSPHHLTREEHLLVDLIQSDQEQNSGLQSYIRNLMMVMAFDAERRGRLISQRELNEYTRHLAVAVTDALHYFIGHDDPLPQREARYCAVTGAHITHMLRDTLDDVAAGYFNIPHEFLESHQIDPEAVETDSYREWVKNRVQLARANFQTGKEYLARVKNRRCRIAGFAYMARFEAVLDAIEGANYRLQSEYPQRNSLTTGLRMAWSILTRSLMFPGSRSLIAHKEVGNH